MKDKNYNYEIIKGFEKRMLMACVFARGTIHGEMFEAVFLWPKNHENPKWVIDYQVSYTSAESSHNHYEIQPELIFELDKIVQDALKNNTTE